MTASHSGDGISSDAPRVSQPNYVISTDGLLNQFQVDAESGLTDSQVLKKRGQSGPNDLPVASVTPAWRKLIAQFEELVVCILVIAALIAGLLGDWIESLAILAIVVLNGIIGFLQEQKAEHALAALQKLSSPIARVLRNHSMQKIPATELVPGDIIELEAGDNIPADVRLLTSFGMRVQESALTGESEPVPKNAETVLGPGTPLGDRCNMAYMGTVTVSGRARGLVVETGINTELGQIAGILQSCKPEPTPLQRRLAELGKVLALVCLAIVIVIFALQLARGGAMLETLLVAVSLGVAAVPEGLPAVVTLTLGLGLQRLVQRNALVRKLPSVETLGSVTVICTDKTGTLTRNEMTVREIFTANDHFEVSGSGYVPHGEFQKFDSPESTTMSRINPADETDLLFALTIAARCNNAQVLPGKGDVNTWHVIGDPTEGALVVAALKLGIESRDAGHHVLFEIPFDSERKMMSVVIKGPDGVPCMYTKGAPEVVIPRCVSEYRGGRVVPLTEQRRQQIDRWNTDLAVRALRVLALAWHHGSSENPQDYGETDLVFGGLVGMIDPPREEAKEAVSRCRAAGIRPVVMTGDHPETAMAIAREIGIAIAGDRVVTGQELNSISDKDLASGLEANVVYARVTAEDKLRVVKAWQQRGEVVAMTGDGINDAPAIKVADIGIAMGISGTDVTKETADMVLTDDNFASIVNAIQEGRGIFDNIQKVVHYLLSCNAGEILLMLSAAIAGWPVPLTAVQILWINLVTDGLPALALGLDPPQRDLMSRSPRSPHAGVLTWPQGFWILFHGSLMATVAAIGFWYIYQGREENLVHARTVTFCITAFSQLLFVIGCRSQRFTILEFGLFSNLPLMGAVVASSLLQILVVILPATRPIFETSLRPAAEWLMIGSLSIAPLLLVECIKRRNTGMGKDVSRTERSAGESVLQ